MNNRFPVSGIILPLIYLFSAVSCILFSSEIYESTFNIVSVFDHEFNIFQIGIWNLFYAIILRILFVKYQEVYLDLLWIFALLEFVLLSNSLYVFYEFRIQHILYASVIHFGFLYLLIHERRIFKK